MLIKLFIVAIVAVVLGFIAGWYMARPGINSNGEIYLGKNEDGDDRIVFHLGMEYDEIGDCDQIVFKVIKEK